MLFWNRDKQMKIEHDKDTKLSAAIRVHKKRQEKVIDQTVEDVNRLNALMKRNGITFMIHIASSGEHK